MKRIAFAFAAVALAAAAFWMLRSPDSPREPQDLAAVQAAYERATSSTERVLLLRRASTLADRGVARWLAATAESDPAVTSQAAAALGAITNRAEASDLAELASGTASVVVRANATRALATAGSAREVTVLAALLQDRAQPLRVRQEAALALGGIGDRASVPVLVATVRSTDDSQLRISAIQALGALGTEDARAFLNAYAQTELSQTERAFVAKATTARTRR